MTVNWLLTGVPGIGKTTVVETVLSRLPELRTAGFITREIRRQEGRMGFDIIDTTGRRRILAHVDMAVTQRVGRYGVDIPGFERFLETIRFGDKTIDLIVIDEIGKMECLSPLFRRLVPHLLAGPIPVLASAARYGGGLIAEVKRRSDVILFEVHRSNRNGLPEELVEEIRLATGVRTAEPP